MTRALALVFLALATTASAQTGTPPPEPDGYRQGDYRASVPTTLRGASVLDTARAYELWRKKTAAFVDALPHAPKPEGLPANAIWREQPRYDIPGSVWLPDTGFGEISEATQLYLVHGLAKATGGDKSKPVVFYCLANCWMSWNAAKRAMKIGYVNVFWYPEGTDGWAAANYPLEKASPEPRK